MWHRGTSTDYNVSVPPSSFLLLNTSGSSPTIVQFLCGDLWNNLFCHPFWNNGGEKLSQPLSAHFFRWKPAQVPFGMCKSLQKKCMENSPWWALICGRMLWRSSSDFLWYSAWNSISYPRQTESSEKQSTMENHKSLSSFTLERSCTDRLKVACIVNFFGHKTVHVCW